MTNEEMRKHLMRKHQAQYNIFKAEPTDKNSQSQGKNLLKLTSHWIKMRFFWFQNAFKAQNELSHPLTKVPFLPTKLYENRFFSVI